jgi:hypothetical protein
MVGWAYAEVPPSIRSSARDHTAPGAITGVGSQRCRSPPSRPAAACVTVISLVARPATGRWRTVRVRQSWSGWSPIVPQRGQV